VPEGVGAAWLPEPVRCMDCPLYLAVKAQRGLAIGGGGVVLFGVFHFALEFDIIGAFIFALCIVVPAYVISDRSLTKIEKQRIGVIYMIAFS